MEDYEEARVALTENQLNMLKSSAKNETETLPHELLLGTRQKRKQ